MKTGLAPARVLPYKANAALSGINLGSANQLSGCVGGQVNEFRNLV